MRMQVNKYKVMHALHVQVLKFPRATNKWFMIIFLNPCFLNFTCFIVIYLENLQPSTFLEAVCAR